MVLLKINGKDYTKFVNETSYNVSPTSIVEEWEDADILFHEGEYRKRIEGEFDMVFTLDSEYNDFIADMVIASNGRVTALEVYVGGLTNDVVQGNFFCTVTSASHQKISDARIFNKLNVKIKEQ